MPVIRVFPRRTSYTPTDPYAFVGDPPLWIPDASIVRVSCTFTWDMNEAQRLAAGWKERTGLPTFIGGPAYEGPGVYGAFESGVYVKPGVTFTTRGCVRNCP